MAGPEIALALGGTMLAKSMMKPPKLPAAREAPSPDDPKKRRAAERASQLKYAKGGRAGTMLTSDESKLG